MNNEHLGLRVQLISEITQHITPQVVSFSLKKVDSTYNAIALQNCWLLFLTTLKQPQTDMKPEIKQFFIHIVGKIILVMVMK